MENGSTNRATHEPTATSHLSRPTQGPTNGSTTMHSPARIEHGNNVLHNGKLRYPDHLSRNNGKPGSEGGFMNTNLTVPTSEIGARFKHGAGDTEHMCGAFGRYPKWLQRFADPRWFLLAYCIQNIISGAEATFLVGCTTSIEKHFQFSSGDFGLLLLLSELGPIIATVFLSFMGSRGNRPRWMALGLALGGLGVFLIFSTFLIYPAPILSESGLLDDSKKFCDLQDVINFQFLNSTTTTSSSLGSSAYTNEQGINGECSGGNSSAFFIWLIGLLCKALSGTMLFTIGAPYLDDSISKNSSPIYFAISISIRVLGPTIGFILSAVALNVYVYPGEHFGITTQDPRWIGAWWMGSLAFSSLMLAYSFVLSLFPRRIKRPEFNLDAEKEQPKIGGVLDKALSDEDIVRTAVIPKEDAQNYGPLGDDGETHSGLDGDNDVHTRNMRLHRNGYDDSNWSNIDENLDEHVERNKINGFNDINRRINGHYAESNGQHKLPKEKTIHKYSMKNFVPESQKNNIKELLKALKRLSKNPVVIFIALSDFSVMVAEFGMFFWMAKYQEHQFRVTKSKSTLFSGVSGTTSLLIGVLIGGIWIRKCRPKGRTVAYMMTLCSAVYLLTLILLMFVKCDFQEDLPGILSPDTKSVELYRGCSSGCICDLKEFIPVCIRDGPISLTYFSPCHAGCPDNNVQANLPNTPINPGIEDNLLGNNQLEFFQNCTCGSPTASVTAGYCQDTCSGFLLYNLITIIIRSFISIGVIGGTLISMRCVEEQDKALILGIKTTMLSAALIVNPIIYGSLIDSSCLVWEEICGRKGSCWLYNTDDFRYKLHGVTAFFIFLCVSFTFAMARKIGDLQLLDEEPSPSNSPATSPTSSILFSGPMDGRKSSIRRSLKKISRLVGRENGKSRSPGRKKEENIDEQHVNREVENTIDKEERDNKIEDNNFDSELSISQEEYNPVPSNNILPSRVIKTTGV